MSWTFYAVFLGTIISIVFLTKIAYDEHDAPNPRTLSELAAAEEALLKRFSMVLIICNTLFAIASFGFIVPRLGKYSWLSFILMAVMNLSIYLLALIPARGKTSGLHLVIAQFMASSMILIAYLFWWQFDGVYAAAELVLASSITVLGALTIIDKRRYIFYELPFIFLSHLTLMVAALSVR